MRTTVAGGSLATAVPGVPRAAWARAVLGLGRLRPLVQERCASEAGRRRQAGSGGSIGTTLTGVGSCLFGAVLLARRFGAGHACARPGAARDGLADDGCDGLARRARRSDARRKLLLGIDIAAVDYSPALQLADPLAALVPFQPSYEDRPAGPDRVFAAVDDAAYERLVAAWAEALARAGAGTADLLHLHHLTPVHEAALRTFPSLPILGQLHGTELAFLRAGGGASSSWRHARAWEERLRRWAQACERLIVPPGAEAEVAALLGLERSRLHGLPSGVELERFQPSPLAGEARRAFWHRWLVEDPQGWDEQGQPGTISYRNEQLAPFASEPVFLYLGRFTAVKRLPLLIRAHARAQAAPSGPARSSSSAATPANGKASIRSRRSDRSASRTSSSPAGVRTSSCPRH